MNTNKRPYRTTLLLSFFLGSFGAHRFYVGRVKSGVLMYLTGGGLGIWWLIDFISILTGRFKDYEGKPIQR